MTGSERDSPAIAKTPPQIGNYIILPHTIGSGAFATVWLALNIKVIFLLSLLSPRLLADILEESEIDVEASRLQEDE